MSYHLATLGPRIWRIASALALVVSVAMVLASCSPRPDPRLNVVLVCIDTLRADHVGSYGYRRPTTPTIDGLARRGVRFEHVQATSPWTVPSTVSILTSLMPTAHGSVRTGRVKLPNVTPLEMRADVTTLAEVLRDAGYRTALISGNPFIFGRIHRGFDHSVARQMTVSDLKEEALDWLGTDVSSPFFLYLQPIDLHLPTRPPEPYFGLFEAAAGGERGEEHHGWEYSQVTDLEDEAFVRFSQHKVAVYDGALRYVDEAISELLAALETSGAAHRTLIVVTSDHGEEFWDHVEIERRLGADSRGYWGIDHGHSFFQELLRVPLVIAGPGVARGRSVRCPVSLLDLAPTVLDMVGVAAAETMQGESRAAFLYEDGSPQECQPSPLFAEAPAFGLNARSVVVRGRYKLIDRVDGVRLLFDLEDDPAEQHDLAAERPELVARLSRLFGRAEPPVEEGEQMQLDEETTEQLKALGYLQ